MDYLSPLGNSSAWKVRPRGYLGNQVDCPTLSPIPTGKAAVLMEHVLHLMVRRPSEDQPIKVKYFSTHLCIGLLGLLRPVLPSIYSWHTSETNGQVKKERRGSWHTAVPPKSISSLPPTPCLPPFPPCHAPAANGTNAASTYCCCRITAHGWDMTVLFKSLMGCHRGWWAKICSLLPGGWDEISGAEATGWEIPGGFQKETLKPKSSLTTELWCW